jgi:DNA-binding MarR family transcriptional regulator
MYPSTIQYCQSLTFRLDRAAHSMTMLVGRVLRKTYGLRPLEWGILSMLLEGGNLTQFELCNRSGLDKVSVSRASQRLFALQYIVRAKSNSDRRSHYLVLTGEGESVARDVATKVAKLEANLLSQFSQDEAAALFTSLAEIRSAVSEDSADNQSSDGPFDFDDRDAA